MIHRTPFFLPWLYPSLLWRVPSTEKVLYLTFDDGPVTGPTEFALHTLGRFDALATFFCIGDNITKYPLVFQKIVNDGHAIGNHTFNHLNGWKTGATRYTENTAQCQSEILSKRDEAIARVDNPFSKAAPVSNLFRPPYGRITRRQIKMLSQYQIVMWDVLSMDYNKFLSSEACLRNTIGACRPGSIVVFHDSYKAERNMMYVLPRLMDHFASAGYTFKAIRR